MVDTFKRIKKVSLIRLKGMELERNYSSFENEFNSYHYSFPNDFGDAP